MSHPNETTEKNILIRHLELMEGLTTYLILDNYTVESNPNLKQKSLKILEQITDLKNHITY